MIVNVKICQLNDLGRLGDFFTIHKVQETVQKDGNYILSIGFVGTSSTQSIRFVNSLKCTDIFDECTAL